MRAKATSRVCLLACLLLTQATIAAEAAAPVPALDFLEYLGSLEKDGKTWIGPEQMEDMNAAEESQKSRTEKPAETEVSR